MKRSLYSPSSAAERAEAHARAAIERERAINRVIASRNPCMPSTERYRRGPLPSWDPRFGVPVDYLRYVARREMGRFDPLVDYPAPHVPHAYRCKP